MTKGKNNNNNNRRDFLQKCGLSTLPFLIPTLDTNAMSLSSLSKRQNQVEDKSQISVNFVTDDLFLSPQQYIEKLTEINQAKEIEPDFYGGGGATKALEEEFAKITGKEKAIYLPTGTMANQLAIKLLNENNTKVIVPENSHVFRDEADAAQSVHNKRLIPLGKDKPYFEPKDLENAIEYINKGEVFKSGLGTVVIENPIRRADGMAIPIETIKEISNYCKKNGYKMHLDGARIHLASAFTNIPVSEYASYFDTVYISLYKYLNANGGAMLCGDSKVIDQVAHQIKIYGGTVFQSWCNTAVALHYLDGLDQRWSKVVQTANDLITELNNIDGVNISSLKNGTNIFDLKLDDTINLKELARHLHKEHDMYLGRANEQGIVKLTINESLMSRDLEEIINVWKEGIKKVRG